VAQKHASKQRAIDDTHLSLFIWSLCHRSYAQNVARIRQACYKTISVHNAVVDRWHEEHGG
jgi:hypothetical protein